MPYTPALKFAREFFEETPGSTLQKFSFEDMKRLGEDRLRRPITLARIRALYDAEIRQTDAMLAPLLKQLRRSDQGRETCILVTSDHGEGFNEHGYLLHDRASLFEDVIRVPLILWCSKSNKSQRGQVVDVPVGVVDVTPTLLDLAGLGPSEELDGRSLLPLINDKTGNERSTAAKRVIVSDADFTVENLKADDPVGDYRLALRRDSLKLIYDSRSGTRHLYDLDKDPGETTDIAEKRPNALLSFEANLRREIKKRSSLPAYEENRDGLPDDQRDQLRALGYLLPETSGDPSL